LVLAAIEKEGWRENMQGCSENGSMAGATGRSPADVNRKSDTGELPLAPTAFIFMRQRVRLQAHEELLP
jgi:hypothetical protein